MTSANATLQRRLSLLRRILLSPAPRDILTGYVHQELLDAYPPDDPAKTHNDFNNDVKALRAWGVDIRVEDKEYRVESYGDFAPVALPEAHMATVAFLLETFGPDTPGHDDVHRLLHRVLDWLPETQRDTISSRRQRLRVEMKRRDEDVVAPAVRTALDRAVGRQLLRFDYLAPGQADGVPRTHVVQPWELYFDATRGHEYLDGYRVSVTGPYGEWREGAWQRYRPVRILPESIEVLPDRLPPTPPKRPRHRLDYLLAPELARLGQVGKHFDDMEVHSPDAEGWVRVTATTDNLFRAVRVLLSYGPACRVLGDDEARREVKRLAEQTAAWYAGEDEKTG